jgi:catechol 2,3-dioxygenase-like lactoylglutathione lyase family enzyme
VSGTTGSPTLVNVWYRVRDLDAGRAFYTGVLGFEETFADEEGRWARLRRGDMEIALWEASGDEGGVASITVPDVRAEADRLRAEGVEVGVIVEVHGQVRIVDVFDPDGNRVQLTEEVAEQ